MSKRDARYEFIRVISMILVIGVHSLANTPAHSAPETLAEHIFSTVFFLCNGLFFMISGKFALNTRCDTGRDYLRFYLKRFGSIGIPVLLGMFLRAVFNAGGWSDYCLTRDFLREYITGVLGGFAECEYWFLYQLAGMLLLSPFLGKLLHSASKTDLAALLAVGFGCNALQYIIPKLGFSFSWTYPLSGWIMLFLLGWGLERLAATDRAEKLVMILGAAAFVIGVVLQCLGVISSVHFKDPLYVLMVSGAFLALKRLYRPGRVADRVFCAVGRHSLTVYLVHMIVMYRILPLLPEMNFFLRLPAVILSTAGGSLLLAFLLDHTVFAGAQWLWRKLLRL